METVAERLEMADMIGSKYFKVGTPKATKTVQMTLDSFGETAES